MGINPMTIKKTYGLLKREGSITIDRRNGAKVNILCSGNLEEDINFELSFIFMWKILQ